VDEKSCLLYKGQKFTDEKKIIVTNGFRKKTNKLPKSEKDLAIKYRQDYLERKNGGK